MPALDWVLVNRMSCSCTLVDSALCGRYDMLSFFCTSEVLADSGLSPPPTANQARMASTGSSQRHTPRERPARLSVDFSTSCTAVMMSPSPLAETIGGVLRAAVGPPTL